MVNLENEIKAYAIKNALEHGKADASKVMPKLFNHGLEKSEIKIVMPLITKTIKEINSLKKDKLETLFKEYSQYVLEKEEKETGLPELENPSSKMVFRLAPFPSGALHIGNAKTFVLNALYSEKYNAKTLLVMDDTIGSAEKQIAPDAYNLIEEGFQWLGVKYEKPVIYKSDRLKIYYEYAEKLIKGNHAYVCHCPQEKLREHREKGIECGCRQFPVKDQQKRWKDMFEAAEGTAVLRIKTSMLHPNPAFRDRVLFKISDRVHPRVGSKYRVWPTLDMCWAIDDHLLGITHIIRGSDLFIETDMEKFIWDIFKWDHPVTIHTGFVNIEGIENMSKSKSQKEVASGEYSGWDDPRTWSMQSLKRRGIRPEAIREFIESIGLNKQNITLPVDSLYSINRKLVDQEANRYSLVTEPIELIIKNKPEPKIVEVPMHPDKKETRAIKVDRIFISKNDFEKLKGKEIRLLHLYNLKLDKEAKNNTAEAKFTSLENKDIPKINWVSDAINCTILMPTGEKVAAIAESSIKTLKNSEIVQFERFAFCRLDQITAETYEFWYSHR